MQSGTENLLEPNSHTSSQINFYEQRIRQLEERLERLDSPHNESALSFTASIKLLFHKTYGVVVNIGSRCKQLFSGRTIIEFLALSSVTLGLSNVIYNQRKESNTQKNNIKYLIEANESLMNKCYNFSMQKSNELEKKIDYILSMYNKHTHPVTGQTTGHNGIGGTHAHQLFNIETSPVRLPIVLNSSDTQKSLLNQQTETTGVHRRKRIALLQP